MTDIVLLAYRPLFIEPNADIVWLMGIFPVRVDSLLLVDMVLWMAIEKAWRPVVTHKRSRLYAGMPISQKCISTAGNHLQARVGINAVEAVEILTDSLFLIG